MPLSLSEEEELQLEIEKAKVKTQTESARNTKLESEITQGTPFAAMRDNPNQAQAESNIAINKARRESANLNPISASVIAAKGLGKGIVNAGINTIGLANSAGSAAGKFLGEEYDKFAPSVGLSPRDPETVKAGLAQNVQNRSAIDSLKFEPSNDYEEVLIPTGEIGAGIVAGNKAAAASKLGEAMTGFGGKAVRYGKGFLGADVGASTTMDKDTPTLFMPELQPKEGDDPNTVELKKTLNLAADNVLTTLAIGGPTKLAGAGVNYFKGVFSKAFSHWNNLPDIEKGFVSDILEIGANIPENATTQQRLAAQKELLDKMEAHSKTTVELSDEVIPDKAYDRDTISTVFDTLDKNNPVDQAKRYQLEGLRSSAIATGAPQLENTLAKPKEFLHETLGDIHATRGGDEAIEQTRQNLQSQAREEAEATRIPPELAKRDLSEEESNLNTALKSDETFGPKFKEAENSGIKLDINEEARNRKTDLLLKTKEARAANKEARDTAYKEVGETGAPAKMDEFMDVYNQNIDFVPDNIKTLVDNADGTFAYLNNEIRPRLSEAITAAYKTNDIFKAEALQKVRDNITRDQMAYMTEIGSDRVAQAALKANKVNKEYTALHNQGVGKELTLNEKINRPRTQEIDYLEKGRDILTNVIKNPNRKESLDQLRKIVGPEHEDKIADIALAESMKDITSSGDLKKITSDLQQMANAFTGKQKSRIEGFLTDIRDRNATIEDLKSRIPELEKDAAEARYEIFSNKYKGLFKDIRSTGEAKEVTNGYKAFKKILENPESDELSNIIEVAKRNPEDMKGLQAAWSKAATETLNSNTKDIVSFQEQFVKHGKEVFGDTPLVNKILELQSEAKKIVDANKARQSNPLRYAKNQVEANKAINTMLTWAFGVLNPTAARIRTITSDIMRENSSEATSRKAADNILSSAPRFIEIGRSLLDEIQSKVSPAAKRQIFQFGLKLGIYGLRDQTDQNLNK